MSTRDLTYLISFDTSGTDELGTAAEDLESLAGAAEDLDETPTLDLGLEEIETAPEDIGAVGTALDDLPIEDAGSRWGGLTDVLGQFGLTSIGVGEAVSLAMTAFEFGQGVLESFGAEAEEVRRHTDEVAAALSSASGAVSVISEAFAGIDATSGATAAEQLNNAIFQEDPDAYEKAARALGELGLNYSELGGILTDLTGEGTDASLALRELASTQISDEFGAQIANAVDNTDDMGEAVENARAAVEALGGEWTPALEEGTRALEELQDQVESIDLNRLAEQELSLAASLGDTNRELIALAKQELNFGTDPLVQAIDVWDLYVEKLNESNEATDEQIATAEEQDAAMRAAAAGATALGDALGSIDWQDAEVAGATTAMASFTDGLFAVDNATQSVEEAFARFAGAVGEDPLNFDVTTEAGRRQQDALEGVANALDTQFTAAFDAANGSQEDFVATATEIGDATLARLTEELNLSAEEAGLLAEALGLTEGDYEARFQLSADQTAIERLGLLQSAIAGLPAEVSTQVNTLIAAGDPQAALDVITAFYSDPANAPTVEVGTTVDTTGVEDAATEVSEQDYEVEFSTTAPTADETASDLDEVAEPRTSDFDINIVQYVVALALMVALAQPRTANITANALTAVADIELDNVARARTAPVDAFLRDFPTRDQIVSRMTGGLGYLRIPVDTYPRNITRLSGARPV